MSVLSKTASIDSGLSAIGGMAAMAFGAVTLGPAWAGLDIASKALAVGVAAVGAYLTIARFKATSVLWNHPN